MSQLEISPRSIWARSPPAPPPRVRFQPLSAHPPGSAAPRLPRATLHAAHSSRVSNRDTGSWRREIRAPDISFSTTRSVTRAGSVRIYKKITNSPRLTAESWKGTYFLSSSYLQQPLFLPAPEIIAIPLPSLMFNCSRIDFQTKIRLFVRPEVFPAHSFPRNYVRLKARFLNESSGIFI